MSTQKTSAKGTNGEALTKNEAKTTKNTAKTAPQENPEDANLEIQAAMAEADEWKAKAEKLLEEKEAEAKARKQAEDKAKKVTEQHAKDALYIAGIEKKGTLTIEEVLNKAHKLKILVSKLEGLKGKKKELGAFKFGNNTDSESLTIKCGNEVFSTHSSKVLQEVRSLIEKMIDNAIGEAESHLLKIG